MAVGALAMISLDNPMVAATAIASAMTHEVVHLPAQEPVNIPQGGNPHAQDVSNCPGIEIYSLLTRWIRSTKRPFRAPERPPSADAGMGPQDSRLHII